MFKDAGHQILILQCQNNIILQFMTDDNRLYRYSVMQSVICNDTGALTAVM